MFIGIASFSLFISFFLPESPKYLVQAKQYLRAQDSYNFIARMNKKAHLQLTRSSDRFVQESKMDRRALKRHLKKAQKEGMKMQPSETVQEDAREYLSDSGTEESEMEKGPLRVETSMIANKADLANDDYKRDDDVMS